MSKFKKSGKLVSIVLAAVVAFSSLSAVPVAASAAETSIERSGETSDYWYIPYNGTVVIDGYTGSATDLVIPPEIYGYAVTSIGYAAFEGCTSLVSVTIPDSVTSIDWYTFKNCTSLESITIPDSVTSIGYGAFENTAWYDNQPYGVVYAGKVTYIYKGEMPENTSIELLDGTKGIADYAFEDCTSLESITIPDSVTSIGYGAFYSSTSLVSITIPDSVTSIGEYALGYYSDGYYNQKVEGFTICGYPGSAAEQYAIENGFDFVDVSAPEYTIGDVNDDGRITIADAIEVQKHIASIVTLEGEQLAAADTDGDGRITVADAIGIQKHIAGIASLA